MTSPARLLLSALLLSAVPASAGQAQQAACDADNGGLTLPAGFCARLIGDSLGPVRHLVVAPNGDLWAARRGNEGGLLHLRDSDGDGRIDQVRRFFADGPAGGSGVALGPDAIYYASNNRILRFNWPAGQPLPDSVPQTVVRNLPVEGHAAKGIVLGPDGRLYVSIGSLTNSCQERDRQNRSRGHAPCHELEQRAGVWRFDPRREGQTAHLGARVATGLRNPMALAIEPATGTLHAAVHGRDQLTENWGFPAEEGRENPAEEVFALPEGTDGGWPYCYYDPRRKAKVQAPEYGGDGLRAGDCAAAALPALAFPAHWAPNAALFYTGSQFPAAYRGGLFLAFHGSWNRAPAPQEGFRVVFAPFREGKPTGAWETFAAPAAGPTAIRPSGLAVGPDGTLYVGADANGKIWRIRYRGP